jgi:hypothetical protein
VTPQGCHAPISEILCDTGVDAQPLEERIWPALDALGSSGVRPSIRTAADVSGGHRYRQDLQKRMWQAYAKANDHHIDTRLDDARTLAGLLSRFLRSQAIRAVAMAFRTVSAPFGSSLTCKPR